MSYDRLITTTVVHQQGMLESVREINEYDIPPRHEGNRRARQIGRRHWVKKEEDFFCSHGNGSLMVSFKKSTKHNKVVLKEVRWG